MKLYIVRHGETEWNTLGRMQGGLDSPLTEKGEKNAKLLGESLENTQFDKVFCSPLGRAKQTAELILANKNILIETVDSLREMSFGCWEGMEHTEIESKHPIQQYNFWNRPHLYQPIDGESYEELITRVKQVIERISSKGYDNVLIVTHTAVIKAIYSIVKGHSLDKFWSPPYIHDTCLNVLEINETEKKFVLEADVAHIQKIRKVI